MLNSEGHLGIRHPGGGMWVVPHLLTWGEAADAHATLESLSGSGFDSPSDRDLSDHDADLERYRATAVLRAAPGALCSACWALSCWECGEEVVEAVVEDAIAAGDAPDECGRMRCRRCRLLG